MHTTNSTFKEPTCIYDTPSALIPAGLKPRCLDELCAPFSNLSKPAQIDAVLLILHNARISPLDFMAKLADSSTALGENFRSQWYRPDCDVLDRFLDAIMQDMRGLIKMKTWMKPHAIELVELTVYEEMSVVQSQLYLPSLESVTASFIDTWSRDTILAPAAAAAPTLRRLLLSAAETDSAKAKNKKKSPEIWASVFGLFLWSTGSQRKTIDALHRCGLSISYDSILSCLNTLGTDAIKAARVVADGPHMLSYDNINLSTSDAVEQRGAETPKKAQAGTFPIIYSVRLGDGAPDPSVFALGPIRERFLLTKGLDYNRDLRPSTATLKATHHHFCITVIHILFEHCDELKLLLASQPEFQHTPRRPMPKGYRTRYYPLRTTTIEEATVGGNLDVHDNAYLVQLGMTRDQLKKRAILTINDVLTNQRIRTGQLLRKPDVSCWSRREVFQVAIGLFHMGMNLIWLILHIHRGTLAEIGSLTYFFALMDKTRLGAPHPDYYPLLAALKQILHGVILECARDLSGFPSLASFAKSKPTSDDLLKLAVEIVQAFKPMPDALKPDQPSPDRDRAHHNLRLLIRDLLFAFVFIQAISDCDSGRIELIFPQLAMIFRGAGGNNYCSELLHMILNLKHVWTPEFADVVRDNLIVNVSGLEGHGMGVDMNAEHGIRNLKALFAAKGLYSTWDRLGDISACIVQLDKIKKEVCEALGTPYYGSTHKTPDTSKLVWRVAHKVRELDLLKYEADRDGNNLTKKRADVLAVGEAKLRSSSLATFNKRIADMVAGRVVVEEDDELPLMELTLDGDE
ncbi:hypothetical protein FA95DRAFT_1493692 [Auriscalpium vulgare]|uniref:Uncharacterized protein n=1 Tax=Auriscalpium vulgare TaxID=40419 RepID=A0ACB8RRU4_9AGAM|nr:hypothetical protein FA95DRAFT_1493692 [Auriscalpium vulgare]